MFTKNYFSMFHVTFVVLILSFFVALNAHAAAWFAKGPVGGNVRSIAIDPKVPSTLYAGTPAGVYKSTDAGATWTAVNEGLMVLPAEEGRIEFVDVTAGLAIDPSNPTRL